MILCHYDLASLDLPQRGLNICWGWGLDGDATPRPQFHQELDSLEIRRNVVWFLTLFDLLGAPDRMASRNGFSLPPTERRGARRPSHDMASGSSSCYCHKSWLKKLFIYPLSGSATNLSYYIISPWFGHIIDHLMWQHRPANGCCAEGVRKTETKCSKSQLLPRPGTWEHEPAGRNIAHAGATDPVNSPKTCARLTYFVDSWPEETAPEATNEASKPISKLNPCNNPDAKKYKMEPTNPNEHT